MLGRGERALARHLALVFGLVGMGMALGRASAGALFLDRIGYAGLPIMYALLGVVVALCSLAYAAWSDRMLPERLFRWLFSGLAGLLVLNWLGMRAAAGAWVFSAYFLLYETASELLLVHLGHYVAHNLDTGQAKRIAPLALAGMQTGTIVGGLFLLGLVRTLELQHVLLAWAALLLAALAVMGRHHRGAGPSPLFRPEGMGTEAWRAQVGAGLRLLRHEPLVRWASLALFCMVVAFYVLSYSAYRVYAQSFGGEAQLARFFGGLSAATAGVALLLQVFVSGRIIERLGIRRVNLLFPVTTLVSFALMLGFYAWPAALVASFNKDAVMPAFRNPVRNLFFDALPPGQQGRARAMSVMIFLPLALSACGSLLWAVQATEEVRPFLGLGLAAALGYLLFNLRMNRAYVQTLGHHLVARLRTPQHPVEPDGEAAGLLEQGLDTNEPGLLRVHLRALLGAQPERARRAIEVRWMQWSPVAQRAVLDVLAGLRVSWAAETARRLVTHPDRELRTTALRCLLRTGPERLPDATGEAAPPELRVAVLLARMCSEASGGEADCSMFACDGRARRALRAFLAGAAPPGRWSGALRTAALGAVSEALQAPRSYTRLEALRALVYVPGWLPRHLQAQVERQLFECDARLREAVVRLAPRFGTHASELLRVALADGHPGVRRAAARQLVALEGASVWVERLVHGRVTAPRAADALMEVLRYEGELDAGQLEHLLDPVLDQAQHMKTAAACLRGASAVHAVLRRSCAQRTRAWLRLALRIMAWRGREATLLEAARLGLDSPDPRSRAGAEEAIGNVEERQYARRLRALLEPGSGTPCTGWSPARLEASDDAWLACCLGVLDAREEESPMLQLFERIRVLHGMDLFADVDEEDLRHVALWLEPLGCSAGQCVFREGEPGDRMYVIERGRVLLERKGPGGVVELGRLGPGHAFGEMNLLDGLPRSATARMLEDGMLLTMHRDRLHALIQSYPRIGIGMLRALSVRLRQTTERIGGDH